MKNKKETMIVGVLSLVILVSAFLFAGCGGGGGSESAVNNTNPSNDESSNEPVGESEESPVEPVDEPGEDPTEPTNELPPDPGEAGMATIEGVDSDNDGVRDDVERYIVLTYPNSEKSQAALMQYARNMQEILLDADSKELSLKHSKEGEKSRACGYYIFGGVREYAVVRENLIVQLLNTEDRSKAYFKYNDNLSGEVFSGIPRDQRAAACEFDPSALAN